jgi:hypothetical protein
MEKTMKYVIVILAIALSACAPNFSEGTRVGVVTKLSHKGLIWKSWEGEMTQALSAETAMTGQAPRFTFNVDPRAVEKVKAALASGKRVELVYRQWALAPPSIDSKTVIVDVK